MEIDNNPEDMDRKEIIDQYQEIQRLRENEKSKNIALNMAKRQMELWDYAKSKGFHKQLL